MRAEIVQISARWAVSPLASPAPVLAACLRLSTASRSRSVSSSVWRTVIPVVSIGSPTLQRQLAGIKDGACESAADRRRRSARWAPAAPGREWPGRPHRREKAAIAGGGALTLGEDKQRHSRAQRLHAAPRLESVLCGLSVSMGIWPERSKYQPIKAIGQSSFFARMRNWKGSAAKITGVSMYEVWLEA